LGCIFSEIFQRTVFSPEKLKYLFKGDSCFPLSPVNQKENGSQMNISEDDQMIKIMQELGVNERETQFINSPASKNYIR